MSVEKVIKLFSYTLVALIHLFFFSFGARLIKGAHSDGGVFRDK